MARQPQVRLVLRELQAVFQERQLPEQQRAFLVLLIPQAVFQVVPVQRPEPALVRVPLLLPVVWVRVQVLEALLSVLEQGQRPSVVRLAHRLVPVSLQVSVQVRVPLQGLAQQVLRPEAMLAEQHFGWLAVS